jgi:glycosyltransferase involved in cell wall biosynthesis
MPDEKNLIFDTRFLQNHRRGGIARDSRSFLSEFIINDWSIFYLNYANSHLGPIQAQTINQFTARSFKFEFLKAASTRLPLRVKGAGDGIFYKSQISPIRISVNEKRARTIIRVHDMFPVTNPEWFKKQSVIQFKVGLSSLQAGSILLANSISTLNSLKEILGSDLSKYTTSIIPCQQMPDQNLERCADCPLCLRGIPAKNFLLAVGTIEPRKNYSRLVKAWNNSRLPKREFSLLIVGNKGWNYSNEIKQIFESSHVYHLSNICDFQLNELYKRAAAFVSSSLNEGYNIPLDEARSKRKQLLLSKIGVHQERIRQDEAMWFDPLNLDSMIDVLNSFEHERENNYFRAPLNSFETDFLKFSKMIKEVF